jgi:putative hydrolase of the HAD superfamily
MAQRAFDLVAFDGDDTLWHNERSYREARDRFQRLLARAGVDLSEADVEACVNRTELANLQYFGYGVSGFTLSLIETAIEMTRGRITSPDLRELIDLAREMVTRDIELFPGAREVLEALSGTYRLMLVTKGDLLHQTSKLERSGLREYFTFVEVVSRKTPDVYAAILDRHGVEPDRFLMVGNSLRSDVLPVIEAGGWAVYVPAALSWSHEHAEVPDETRARCFEVPELGALIPLVGTLAAR